MKVTNKVYNVLKALAQVVLPAAGTLYFALAGIWMFPHPKEVVGSITAVDAFLGVVLSLLSSAYSPPNDGQLTVDKNDPVKNLYSLDLTTPLSVVEGKNAIVLAVHHVPIAAKEEV